MPQPRPHPYHSPSHKCPSSPQPPARRARRAPALALRFDQRLVPKQWLLSFFEEDFHAQLAAEQVVFAQLGVLTQQVCLAGGALQFQVVQGVFIGF